MGRQAQGAGNLAMVVPFQHQGQHFLLSLGQYGGFTLRAD